MVTAYPTTYYIAPNGSSGNTGLSTNSAWPLLYALQNVGDSNTIILLPGTYAQSEAHFVTNSWVTIRSQKKWGAWLVNSPDSSLEVSNTTWAVNGVVLDGLVVSNAQQNGFLFRSGSNHVVRNCWIMRTASTFTGTSPSGSGITTLPVCNLLIENNLIEYNGHVQYGDHGMYLSGTNCIVRNNVSRYNMAMGLQIYNGTDGSDQFQVYNNLIYGNATGGTQDQVSEMLLYPRGGGIAAPRTNWVFGNTFVTTNPFAIQVEYGESGWFTNNIIVSGGTNGFYPYGTVYGDYNLSPTVLRGAGPHDVVTNYFGFVNASGGLYWLAADSPARGRALGGACGPNDFFGNAQSSATDIGAFQYNPAYASDTRVLDPSAAIPDYWANLTRTGTLTFQAPAGTLTPPFLATNGYIFQPVTTTVANGGQAVYNFTVTNAARYVIQALVNARAIGANSFYINVDAQPQDPSMIWDVPITTGFEVRLASWRGAGTAGSDQFVPITFNLAPGAHQLIIVGRDANTLLEQLSILQIPAAPQNFRVVTGP